MARAHFFLFFIAFIISLSALPREAAGQGEYIIISGGPALEKWEQFRVPADHHDKWWGNFIRTARIRMDELNKSLGPETSLTWLVYKPGYDRRASEEGRPLIGFIQSVATRNNANLVWYYTGKDVISYLNSGRNRAATKVAGLEYFGHSNKYCWIFDYSSQVLGASKAWLHENDFRFIQPTIFTANPYIKSWGCHTAESMSAQWRYYTRTKMWGAYGKTDYSESWKNVLPHISTPGGRWAQ